MASFFDSVKTEVFGVIKKAVSIPSSLGFGGNNLFYPIDIVSVPNRPLIRFTCMVPIQGYTNIYFPMPEGVQMNDAMSYNGQDLNILGYAAQQAVRVGTSVSEITAPSWAEGFDAAGQAIKAGLPQDRAETATLAGGLLSNNAAIKAGISAVTQISMNKNTITTFDGINIRTHSFTFKLIARSPEESQSIKNIHYVFRSGMYPVDIPGKANMMLSFPPKWQIRFVSLDGSDLPHLPQPYECYLQNLSTNFNPSSKMFRNDMAPLEVDITVAFIETKALTMNDIASLQGGFRADGRNRGENIPLNLSIKGLVPAKVTNVLNALGGGTTSNAPLTPPGSVGSSGSGQESVTLFNPNNDGITPANGSLPIFTMNKEGNRFLP